MTINEILAKREETSVRKLCASQPSTERTMCVSLAPPHGVKPMLKVT
jgi:hypothetical protein